MKGLYSADEVQMWVLRSAAQYLQATLKTLGLVCASVSTLEALPSRLQPHQDDLANITYEIEKNKLARKGKRSGSGKLATRPVVTPVAVAPVAPVAPVKKEKVQSKPHTAKKVTTTVVATKKAIVAPVTPVTPVTPTAEKRPMSESVRLMISSTPKPVAPTPTPTTVRRMIASTPVTPVVEHQNGKLAFFSRHFRIA